MTPLEFLSKLKKLRPDTAITLAHLSAAFEMLAPTLKLNSLSAINTPLSKRLTSESSLASWLGEPIATVARWRVTSSPSSQTRYRMGSVCDWIMDHLLPVFSEEVNAGKNGDVQFGDIAAVWKAQIPAMKVNNRLVGFFRTIKEESEPSDYALIDIPLPQIPYSTFSNQNLIQIAKSLIAHGEFSALLSESRFEAKNIFFRWKNDALPEIRLQFFNSALLYDDRLAMEIAGDLPLGLIHDKFNITIWLWQQLVENSFHSINEDVITYAYKVADKYGVNLSHLTPIIDEQGQQLFEGNASHLLADTEGDFFHLLPFNEFYPCYERLISCILDLGLSIDKRNNQGLNARQIAIAVEEKYGQGQSIFKNFIEKYESAKNLEFSLEPKHSHRPKNLI